ncbi:MAG: response regulator, partial [Anaerolineae bacterium]|nr:response regulator [Anaerolineae bacterium]
VVTKSPSAASLIARYLETYRTITVQDFDEALASMHRLIPQAVIIDTNSVVVDAERMDAHNGLAQTLMISCPLPGETPLSRHLSANGYLIKPVSRESLWNTLRQFDGSVERVLVADDDPDFVRMIERMLDTPLKRYQVDRAHTGRETLLKIAHNRPDLVLLDLQMPDVDGFQVMAQLRSSPGLKDIRVVVVSAQEEFDTAKAAHGSLTITKSQGISPLELVHWLQELLK